MIVFLQLSEDLEKVDEKLKCTLVLLDNKVLIQDCANFIPGSKSVFALVLREISISDSAGV